MSYVDGFVLAVPDANRERYRAMAEKAARLWLEFGAERVVEGWGDDVPDGKVTDFRRAVQAKDGETVVFSFVQWPSREARDAGNRRLMEDPRMKDFDMAFDGQRLIFGGFETIVDQGRGG